MIDAPKGVTLIGCKWIFKKKIGAYGQVEAYKARLGAKDFKQKLKGRKTISLQIAQVALNFFLQIYMIKDQILI